MVKMTEKFLKRHKLQCPPPELDVCDLISVVLLIIWVLAHIW